MSRMQGMTIVEILIAGSLTALVLGLVLVTLKMGKDAYRQAADTGPAFRNTTTGLDALSAELRDCAHIYQPDTAGLAKEYHPVEGHPLVVVESGGGGLTQIVALQQGSHDSVERRLYEPASFNPTDSSTWKFIPGSTRVLAVGATEFAVSQVQQPNHTFLKLSLMSPGGTALETMVECFRVPDPVVRP